MSWNTSFNLFAPFVPKNILDDLISLEKLTNQKATSIYVFGGVAI